MPKTPINYSNTFIYKLCCKNPVITDIYIGYSTNYNKRKNAHKTYCNNEKTIKYNMYIYEFMRKNEGWKKWDIIEIIKINCKDKKEAEIKKENTLKH